MMENSFYRKFIDKLKEARAKNLGEIREALIDSFNFIEEEDNPPGPFGNIAIFNKKNTKDINQEKKVISFALATGGKKYPWKLRLDELRMMDSEYPWNTDSFFRHASENGGIWYGRFLEKIVDKKNKMIRLAYEVLQVEKVMPKLNKNPIN